jgi:hypothetical protein
MAVMGIKCNIVIFLLLGHDLKTLRDYLPKGVGEDA